MNYKEICSILSKRKMDFSNMVPKYGTIKKSGVNEIFRITGADERKLLIYEDGNMVYFNNSYENPTVISIHKYWRHKKQVDDLGTLLIKEGSFEEWEEPDYEFLVPNWVAEIMRFGDRRLESNRLRLRTFVSYDDLSESETRRFLSVESSEEAICNSILVKELLDKLNAKQRRVLELRYDLNNEYNHKLTFEEIGRIMFSDEIGKSVDHKNIKQRTKQLHDRAIIRLRKYLTEK